MPGPAPKPADQRARRNATVAMTKLPMSGRQGRAPKWPLAADSESETAIAWTKLAIKDLQDDLNWASVARERSAIRRRIERAKKKLAEQEALKKAASAIEREIWAELWKRPQALQWEMRGYYREVALYARHQAKAEAGSLEDSKEARAREDRLGLNDMAMLRLRWEIYDDTAAAEKPSTPRSKRTSSRYGHLRSVAP